MRKIRTKSSNKRKLILNIFLFLFLLIGVGYSTVFTNLAINGDIVLLNYRDLNIKQTSSTDRTAFRSDTYRENIKTITLNDSISAPSGVIESWDISETGNGGVMAYIVQNANDNTKYDLYIQGNGRIYSNKDSSYLFGGLTSLETINNLNKLTTTKTTNMSNMFNGDSNLAIIDLSNFNMSKVTNTTDMLNGTTSLINLTTPKTYPTDSNVTIILPTSLYDTGNTEYQTLNNTSPTETLIKDDDRILVSFDTNGGKTSTTQKVVTLGQVYGELPTPTKDGYNFIGWTSSNNILPSNYQAVDYIESNGTQVIGSGVYPTINTGVSTKFLITTMSGNPSPISCQESSYLAYGIIIGTTGEERQFAVGNTSWYSGWTGVYAITNTNYTFNYNLFNSNKAIINNTSISLNSSRDIPNRELNIFRGTDTSTTIIGKMYDVLITEGANVSKTLIPCYRITDNKAGYYDVINDEFLTSQVGDNFTYGQNKQYYDMYVTSNVLMKKNTNHSLQAVWMKTDNNITNFDYTGNVQSFTAPENGVYKLETWGAQGGSINSTYYGGYGGYSSGEVSLLSGQSIYITVGGFGGLQNVKQVVLSGGFNGGGNVNGNWWSSNSSSVEKRGSGGGSTNISTSNRGTLNAYKDYINELLIVSSGGGGAIYFEVDYAYHYCKGGSGGGYIGTRSDCITNVDYNDYVLNYRNANQNEGGYSIYTGAISEGTFGLGASGFVGGGSGFYGGTGNYAVSSGGSSYIGNSSLSNKSMYCFGCQESLANSTDAEKNIFTVSTTGTSSYRDTTNCPNGYSSDPISKCAKAGNGYARITFIGTN